MNTTSPESQTQVSQCRKRTFPDPLWKYKCSKTSPENCSWTSKLFLVHKFNSKSPQNTTSSPSIRRKPCSWMTFHPRSLLIRFFCHNWHKSECFAGKFAGNFDWNFHWFSQWTFPVFPFWVQFHFWLGYQTFSMFYSCVIIGILINFP